MDTQIESMEEQPKKIILSRGPDIADYLSKLGESAKKAQNKIAQIAVSNPLGFLFHLKFNKSGYDPMASHRELNLIEQLNQTFTYFVSFKGAEFLFERNPEIKSLTLNLGNRAGWDIETLDHGGLVAEVFAVVSPQNNKKLAKDIEKISAAEAKHRYVIFMCPKPEKRQYTTNGVVVCSLGCAMFESN